MIKRVIFKIILLFTKKYETWAYFLGYYHEDYKPRECVKCGGKTFKEVELDHINGHCIESEINCTKCGNTSNYMYLNHYEVYYKDKYRF